MADSVSLVVSGKTYPEVCKENLVEESYYFRALLSGNYRDSGKDSYKFTGWSTKAFEMLLQYVKTGVVDLRERKLGEIKAALDVAEYLVVDTFRTQLRRSLITSWPLMKVEEALQLAEELNVSKELQEYAFIRVLSAVEIDNSATSRLNYDALILVTGMDRFWDITVGQFEPKDELWNKMLQKYSEVLTLAMQLPPRADKAKVLARNLRLHTLDSKHLPFLWNFLDPSSANYTVLKSALEDSLVNVRKDARSVFSHIRLPFQSGSTHNRIFGVAEFNTNSWSWNVKENVSNFYLRSALVKRDYATFLGQKGLFIVRMQNRNPVFIENRKLGELVTYWSPVRCISGKYLFLLEAEVTSKLYKFDFFSKEFTECGEIPLERPIMKGHGDILYIAGYSEGVFCVFEYKVKASELSLVVRSNIFGLPLQALLVIRRKLYVFADDAYTAVDTLQDEDQELSIFPYVGFVRDMWNFIITEVTIQGDKVLMLLHASIYDYNENPNLLVAELDTATGILTCLCLLPMVLSYYDFPYYYRRADPQMEFRQSKEEPILETDEVLNRLRRPTYDGSPLISLSL